MTMPRARVGLIIPSSNRQVEQEMVPAYPAEVKAHVTRLRMTGPHHTTLANLLPRIREAAGALADAKCDVVAFHCTGTAMQEGPSGEASIREALRAGAHERITTTASAVVHALEALEARKIVLVTPYDQQTTDDEVAFLAAAGFDVLSALASDRGGSDGTCYTPSAFWFDTVRERRHPEADVYFLSCANVTCFAEIARLEAALGRPVITSNQVVVWETLAMTGTGVVPSGLGQLLTKGISTMRAIAS
jgi:maleate isomerase